VSGASNQARLNLLDWLQALPLGWLIFGPPAVTFLLAAAYWFGSYVWGLIWAPKASLGATLLSIPIFFVTMWLPLSFVDFAIASTSQLLAYPLLVICALIVIRWRGQASLPLLLSLTPLLGFLTWYGYDHFVPDFRWYTDERPPYEHGLTLERFLNAWAFEAAVIVGFWWPMRNLRLSEQANG
jgi:hypothetical protein